MNRIKTNDLLLHCEYSSKPLGVDKPAPRFGWLGKGALKEKMQRSYRIEVYLGEKCVWDSGVECVSSSTAIPYAGEVLQSACTYRWRASIETTDNEHYYNEAIFETGLLNEAAWQGAQWIGHPTPVRGVAPLLRRSFHLSAVPSSARLYLSGIGYANVTINGVRTDDSLLDPGWTDYQKTVLYRAWDVTKLLKEGENVLGIELGEGWLGNDHPNFLNLIGSLPSWLSAPKLICLLQADDFILTSQADGRWLASEGAIRQNNVYDGEYYDGRLEKQGWALPGYACQADEWRPAVAVTAPGGVLRCQLMPAIGRRRQIKPFYISYPDDGDAYEVIVDMGVNIAGWAEIKLQGKAGQRVELRYAEVLGANNGVDQRNLRGAKQTDCFVLGKDGENSYEPRFTYHGFRFVQIKTDPGVVITDVCGWEINTLVEQSGDFHCDHAQLQAIYDALIQTERNNLHSVPTDCPQRDERLGWINDMTVRCEEGLYNFDMICLYEKWLQDIEDAQDEDTGAIPDTAPYFFGGKPAFHVSSVYVILPWLLYQFYNDAYAIKRHYEGMKRYVSFKLSQREENGLVSANFFGDWAAPMAESLLGWGENALPKNNPQQLVTTCYLCYDCKLMEKMAYLLGRDADAAQYHHLQQTLAEAINRAYFHEEGYYAENSQGANVFPLFLDIVPDGKRGIVLQNVLTDLQDLRKGRLSTGNQLTKYLYEVLLQEGKHQEALALASYDEYPSIGFMLKNGATTLWERWEKMAGNHMNSHNHPMLGAFTVWFQKCLCGINPQQRTQDGRLQLAPKNVNGINEAAASMRTPRGQLSLKWQRSEGKLIFNVDIPWGESVDFIPPLPINTINGAPISASKPLTLLPGKHTLTCT